MTEKIDYIKVESKSFQDMCAKIIALEKENQEIKVDNDFLQRQNAACKFRCREYATKVHELELEVADLRFTHKYLTSEEAGTQLAQELLHPDTNFIKAEEAAEQLENEVVGAMGSFLGDDF